MRSSMAGTLAGSSAHNLRSSKAVVRAPQPTRKSRLNISVLRDSGCRRLGCGKQFETQMLRSVATFFIYVADAGERRDAYWPGGKILLLVRLELERHVIATPIGNPQGYGRRVQTKEPMDIGDKDASGRLVEPIPFVGHG